MQEPMNTPSTPVDNTSQKKKRFILSLIGSVTFVIGIGGVACLSQYSVYITSYIHYFDESIDMQYGNLMSPILTSSIGLSAALGGILEKKIGMRLTLTLSFLLLELMVFIFIFLKSIGIVIFLIILLGLSAGLGMPILIKNLMCFYPQKRGVICSLIPSSLILLAAIFSVVGEKIINPEAEELADGEICYKYETAKNFINYFKMILIINPITSVIGIVIMKKFDPAIDYDYSEISKTSENTTPNEEKHELNIKEPEKKKINSQNLKAAIFSKRIWIICGIIQLYNINIEYSINTFRVFGSLVQINGSVMQYGGAFVGISSLIFAPTWGIVNDKINFPNSAKIIGILCLILGLLLSIFIKSNFIYVTSVLLITIPFAGLKTILQPHIMKVYGVKYFIEIGGVIGGIGSIKTLLLGFLSFGVSKFYQTGKELQVIYRYIFIAGVICCGFGLFLSFIEDESKFEYPIPEEDETDNSVSEKKEANLVSVSAE